jgi:hypothetical protein
MRKTICILLALGLLVAGSVPAFAEWRGGYRGPGGYYGPSGHGAGEFFAGLIGGAILGAIIAGSQPVYSAPPPPAYVPQARVWIPGRTETRYERQWVPGYWTTERNRFCRGGEDFDEDGYPCTRRAWVPGHYENVRVEVWVPGYWEERG